MCEARFDEIDELPISESPYCKKGCEVSRNLIS